jgi:hypothetical protein
MSLVESIFQKNSDLFLKVYLEIDQHHETITDFFYKGTLVENHLNELIEIKEKIINKKIDEILQYRQSEFNSLKDSNKIHSLGLWLIHRAIDEFKGRDEVLSPHCKNLCLCFGFSLEDLETSLSLNPELDMDKLITDRNVTSACGGCKKSISEKLDKHRKSLRTKFDSKGKLIKVKELYPAELILILDNSLKKWIDNQKIISNLSAEIMKLEGYHVDVKFLDAFGANVSNPDVLISLKDHWKKELDLDLYLHFSF